MPNQSGFISVAVTALLMTVVLGVSAISMKRAAIHTRASNQALTNQEGFYGSEIAIQNSYWKGVYDVENPAPVAQGGAQPDAMTGFQHSYTVPNAVSNNYVAGSYTAGYPITVAGTAGLDPARFLLRKATGSNIKYVPVGRDSSDSSQVATGTQKICGKMEFDRIGFQAGQCGYAEFAPNTSFAGAAWTRVNGFDDSVWTILPLNDGSGRIYVGGVFRHYRGSPAPGLIRLQANGTIDPTFAVGAGFNYSVVYSIAFMKDGSNRIYVVGSFSTYQGAAANRIIRLNPDGTRDNTFVVGAGFNGTPQKVMAISGGFGERVLVSGSFFDYKGANARHWARLDTLGNLDAGWDPSLVPNNSTPSMAQLSDGSVVLVGNFTQWGATVQNGITRIDPMTGVINAAWNPGTAFFGGAMRDVAIDFADRIYAVGLASQYNGNAIQHIARVMADGTYDPSFVTGSGFDFQVFNIALAGGFAAPLEIYVTGRFWSYNGTSTHHVIRLRDTGAVAPGFSVGTGFNNAPNNTVRAVAVSNDGTGDIFVGGDFSAYNGVGVDGLARMSGLGAPVITFNPGSAFDNYPVAMEIDNLSAGTIYVGGYFTTFDGQVHNRLVRMKSDGTPDPAFNIGTGFATPATAHLGGSPVYDVVKAEGNSGDLYVGGGFDTFNGVGVSRLVRLHSNGFQDLTFNLPAGSITQFAGNSYINAVRPMNDGSGRIYIVGVFDNVSGTATRCIARLNANGSVDGSFNTTGGFSNNCTVMSVELARDASGDIFVAGAFTTYAGAAARQVVRIASDGTMVAGFTAGAGFDMAPTIVFPARDNSNHILVGGGFTTYRGAAASRIIKLDATTGDPVVGFNTGGITDLFGSVQTIATGQNSNEIAIGGLFSSYLGTPTSGFAVIDTNGALVRANNQLNQGGPGVVLRHIHFLPGGDFMISGDFRSYGNTTVDRIIRLHPNDSIN